MKPIEGDHRPDCMRQHWESEATGYVLERRFSAVDEKVLELLGDISGQRILEVGFGSAVTAAAIRKLHPDAVYWGLDFAERFMQIARTKLDRWAHLVRASADAIPFEAGSFDFSFEMDAIHHFPQGQTGRAAAEMTRVIKPGGRMLVVEDWAAAPENQRDKLAHSLQRRRFLTRRGLEYHPTESEWKAMLRGAGLELLDLMRVQRPLNLGCFAELEDPIAREELAQLLILWGDERPTTTMSFFLCRKSR